MPQQNGISPAKFKQVVADLNGIVERVSPGSALFGIETLATACAAMLDVYAMPNENNPQGMCDDPHDFRDYFCSRIMGAPELKPKRRGK